VERFLIALTLTTLGYLIIHGDAMIIQEIIKIISSYLGMEKVARVEKKPYSMRDSMMES
jgi:hypothetical protein